MPDPHRSSRSTSPRPTTAVLADARFSIPVLDRSHVSRPRLIDAMASTGTASVVLVSGPAGSGKTELVADWVRTSEDPNTAWVTFEDRDSAFWPDVFEALRRLGLEIPTVLGAGSADVLAGRSNILALAAALAASGAKWTLVVDGYEISSLPLAREIDLLLRTANEHLRLVLVGRVDPVLPLYRYRLAGEMAEVRGVDLAFTDVEAARLLTRRGATLSADSVHQLNDLVNGWAAGLVFAARAVAGRLSPEKVVATVLGQTTDINEYLVGEVLDDQTPRMREFLLATAITDVMAPGLTAELLGPDAVPLLRAAARANVFVEPVAEDAGTFRYYPFFRSLLRARLAYESPVPLSELHRRAARWYRREGAVELAVEHLVSAGAWQELSELLVQDGWVGRLLLEEGSGVLRAAASELPVGVSTTEACVVRAAVALAAGDLEHCASELVRVRCSPDALEGAVAVTTNVVDALRASGAEDVNTADTLTEVAERSLHNRIGPSDLSELASLSALARGVALLRCGRVGEACEQLTRSASAEALEGYPHFRARCWGLRAIAHALNTDVPAAETTAARAFVTAAEGGPATGDAVAGAHLALALVAVEQYDAPGARQHLAQATTPAAVADSPVDRAVVTMVRGALEWMDGQAEEAGAALMADASALAASDPWLSEALRAAAARVAMAEGMPRLALEALGELGPSTMIVAAAAHVELGEDAEGAELARSAPDEHLALSSRVSRRLVEALVAARAGDTVHSRALLEESLRLAAPAGLRRPFRQTGPALEQLLRDNRNLLLRHRWLTDRTAHGVTAVPPLPGSALRDAAESHPAPVEDLTPKELEVLAGLEALLTTDEIATQMFVSVNTVRTHVRNILRKLGVNRRNAAIRRARELGLLSA